MLNCQRWGKVRGNEVVLANILENVYMVHFIPIFCLRTSVINVTFLHTACKLKSKKTFSVMEKSGKMKT